MKTYEQITADVLARRDAYLAQREQKRRAAKKYAAASLLLFAAVFAAAALFRSGLFRPGHPNGSLPLSLSTTADGRGTDAISPEPSRADNLPTGEDGTKTAEPSAVPTDDQTEPTAGEGPFSRVGNAETKRQEPEPTGRAYAPEESAPQTRTKDGKTPPTPQTEPSSLSPWANYSPVEDHTGASAVEEEPAGSTTTPVTNPAPTNPAAETPVSEPASEPPTKREPETPTRTEPETQKGETAETDRTTYVIYNGGLYAAGDGMTVPIPEEAEVVGKEPVIVVRSDEVIHTEMLVLSCPSEHATIRTAVALENENEMCLMEYLGTVDALLREESP